jgi:hypothetical protein
VRKRAAAGPQARQLRDPTNPLRWSALYLSSAWRSWRGPPLDDVEAFCIFIGYARSGHSLIGSILNAHPEVVISHELDAVRFVEKGFSRDQLFALILERDRVFGTMDRTWSGYDYNVAGQFQGRFERLRVIGDKRGRTTALELGRRPELVERLRAKVGVPLRAVHITRNPFDNIAAESVRRKISLGAATEWFEQSCRGVAAARPRLAPGELIDLAHEKFSEDPTRSIIELCAFFGVEAYPSFVGDAASIVWPGTRKRRDAVSWSAEERGAVEALIDRYDFLHQNTFDH